MKYKKPFQQLYQPVVVVSMGTCFLLANVFSISGGFSSTVVIFSVTSGVVGFSFVKLALGGVGMGGIGGGTGVTTGLLFIGSLLTRRTLISPVWLFKWIWYLLSMPSFCCEMRSRMSLEKL